MMEYVGLTVHFYRVSILSYLQVTGGQCAAAQGIVSVNLQAACQIRCRVRSEITILLFPGFFVLSEKRRHSCSNYYDI